MNILQGIECLRLKAFLRNHDVNISPLELASGPFRIGNVKMHRQSRYPNEVSLSSLDMLIRVVPRS
ncbi:hypothetical protein HP456_03560 [Bacillus haikouensis]|jgi:hypothetical protein|uniref:hypothetical protein n=1 Tax=Bacillus haikouensis TaxID=1510468 RepID=UPI001557A0EF|nr:hypothetical protein [Bacillus haikouensis]NQD64990.1 hypothetical protein [Bacillus haikouensis]